MLHHKVDCSFTEIYSREVSPAVGFILLLALVPEERAERLCIFAQSDEKPKVSQGVFTYPVFRHYFVNAPSVIT